MRRRIFWSMLAVMGVALLIAVDATSVLRQRVLDDRQRELSRQAEVAARLLGEQFTRGVGSDERAARPRIRIVLEQVKRIGGHHYLEAAVVSGSSSVTPVLEASPLIESVHGQISQLLGSDARFRTFQATVDGVPIIATLQIIELEDSDGTTVLIAIGREEPLLQSGQWGNRALLAFGVGAVLAAVLSRRIGRRLERVGAAARRIADGDFTVRADVDGDEDVAVLAGTFNDMAAGLEVSRDREREFLLSVGHDLRTPLTTIRGYAEGLNRGVITADDLPRVAAVLDMQTARLSRLIEDLMLLARLEAREFTMRVEAVDLAALTHGLLESETARSERLGVSLRSNLADVGTAIVDPDRYGQLLGNILDNAFRYSPEGAEIVVSLDIVNGAAQLRVADSGPGIEEADLERVFDRLYVAQRYQPLRPEGSGLGLSIVRELVAAIGGTVRVESTVGAGTALVVSIPLADTQLTGEL